MKKITKRIMALMLSLAMILGCIPSFTNEASAAIGSIKDVLNTLTDPFPTDRNNAWQDEYGNVAFLTSGGGVLNFYKKGEDNPTKSVSTIVQVNENNSTYTCNGGWPFIFNMQNGKLFSISYNQDGFGTLTPVKTIADVLETVENGFPNEPSTGWVSADEYTVFCAGETLWFQNTSENDTINTNTVLTLNADSNYENTDAQITFVMTNEKLTSIVSTKTNYAGTYVPTPIERVDLVSSGILATNIQTIKFEAKEGDDAPYTLNYTNDWFSTNDATPYDFSSTGTAYKKIFLTPKSGYKFVNSTEVYYYDDFSTYGGGNIQSDGTLLARISAPVKAGTISLDFPKPTTYSELLELKADYDGSKTKFKTQGATLGLFDAIPTYNDPFNADERGVYMFCYRLRFTDETERNSIKNVYLNGNKIDDDYKVNIENINDLNTFYEKAISNGLVYCYDNFQYITDILVYEKVDLSKTATITCPITAGTTVEDIKQSIVDSFTTTASTDTGTIADFDDKKDISIINITDERALLDTDALESNKEYYIDIVIDDVEGPVYSSVKVNNTNLTLFTSDPSDPEIKNNHFSITNKGINVFYKFDTKQSSGGGSKTYKAKDDKDTAEKISGLGKKGSKRIVTPQEGRKVESVIVTDKDGNRYEVTNEGDGTYSFIQPGTNVDVEVKYKNRLIELTIGSLDASVDDTHHNLDVVPKVVNDRTMLPIRFVAENLGAKVDWDEKDPNTVVITRGDTRIEITLGSDIAKVNGQEYMLDSVAFAENDRTYLPVRFVSEKLNAIVEWNEAHPMDVKIYERQ